MDSFMDAMRTSRRRSWSEHSCSDSCQRHC